MSGEEKGARARLQFFQSAILAPTFDRNQDFYSEAQTSTVSDLGAIEAAHWALLGVSIGYLDADDALQLISSSEGVLQAWRNLTEKQIIPTEDSWARVIRPGDGGHLVVNAELFSARPEVEPRTQDLLQDTFQTFLLLTAENILDGNSHYFLDSIGWTITEEWEARREGIVAPWRRSSQAIGSGFANVLNYWTEMALVWESGPQNDVDWASGIGPGSMWNFAEAIRWNMGRRFNLDHIEIVERYFELAGEFVERARENTPAWLDARSRIFEEMLSLINYVRTREYAKEDHERLWKVFAEGIEKSSLKRETRRTESPSGRQ